MPTTTTWTGTTDFVFTTATNWDNGAPAAGDTGNFTFSCSVSGVPSNVAFTLHAATAIAVDLGGATIASGALLTRTGTGAFTNLTWSSPNAGATRTQATVASGGVLSGTYDGRIIHPTVLFDNSDNSFDSFVVSGGSTASETWSAVAKQNGEYADAGTYSIRLGDQDNLVFAFMPNVTVTGVAAPTSLVATVVSTTQIDLTWSISEAPDSYDLFRYLNGAHNPPVVTTHPSAGATSVSVTGLTPSTDYYFQLRAENAFGAVSADALANATTTAASSPKQNRLSLSIGMGL